MSVHKIGGLEIYYQIDASEIRSDGDLSESTAPVGDKNWITLINGHTRTLTDFRMMSKTLVANGFNVLSLDNRGSGKTIFDGAFSVEDMANDIVSLWDYLEIEKSHVLGISMGGVIAQSLSAQCFGRIKGLCLVSTYGDYKYGPNQSLDSFSDSNSNSVWGNSYEDTINTLKTYFSDEFFLKNKMLVEAMAKQMRKQIDEGDFLPNAEHQKNAMENFRPEGIDLSEIEKLGLPVLIIHGEIDRVISIEAARCLADRYSESQLIVYEGCGHLLLAEAAKRLYADVSGFLIDVK